jgi:uncharacterized UPF0160 family protein
MQLLEPETSSPLVHSRDIRAELSKLIEHLEADQSRVDDQRFQRLIETSSDILREIRNAFLQYDEQYEKAARQHT